MMAKKKIKPELWISYSWIYDQSIHEWKGLKYKLIPGVSKYREKLQKKWDRIERKAFDTMSKVSGLEWDRPIIQCYIVRGKVRPFSDPLTLPMRKNLDEQLEVILHELTHNIIVQNLDRIRDVDYSKYGKLSLTARIHILVHAILKETLLVIFGEKRTKKAIEYYDDLPKDYKKAWEIVEKEGAKQVIKAHIRN